MDYDLSKHEPSSSSHLLTLLAEIETAADDVLTDRAQIVELDKKRQENRTAERRLKTMLSSKSDQGKTWMCWGTTFVKLPTKTVHGFLESNERSIDKEIQGLRDGLKEKVNKLNELQGKAPVNPAYFLVPLSRQDASRGESKDTT